MNEIEEGTTRYGICKTCKDIVEFTAKKVLVLSPGGAQSTMLWSCENHPLEDMITTRKVES